MGGYHRESPFSVVQAATHLNGETLAFQYFRHRRGRRVGGINQKSDLFHFRLLFARRRCRQNDHIFERVGEELPGQTGRRSVVITACDGMLHDKLRMKASKRYFVLKVKRVEKIGKEFFGKFQPISITNPPKDFLVFFYCRRIYFQFVMNAAELGRIHELLGGKVCGKNNQLIKEHFKFFPGVKRQVVDFSFERKDPAVQQLVRPHALSSKVVDDEYPTDRLHLERGFVIL